MVPKIDHRRNIWDSSELTAGYDDLERVDGDFGLRSPTSSRFKKSFTKNFQKDYGNRRQRNMKVCKLFQQAHVVTFLKYLYKNSIFTTMESGGLSWTDLKITRFLAPAIL